VRRRLAVQHARDKGFSERHACGLVGQWRTTQRYQPTQCDDEDRLTQSILVLASQYGRFGYRRITALLKLAGWRVGKDRVQRIWRREGLKVPARHKPRGRLWLNDGSCIRLRPQHRNHVWSYDFVEARTHDGRSLRLLVMIDEFTRECLSIRVARRLNSAHVIELLGDCMLVYGVPEHVRSDNGAEMTARRVKQWLASVGTKPLFIEPGSPWENGYCESFNGKLRDECLNGEIFYSLKEARVVIEQMAEVLQHSAAAQFAGISGAGAGDLDRGRVGEEHDFSFACRIFHKAGCGRSPGSDDELATLGLDTGPRRLKPSNRQAKVKSEVYIDELYSLSGWYKISVRPPEQSLLHLG
jgi:putative transposase